MNILIFRIVPSQETILVIAKNLMILSSIGVITIGIGTIIARVIANRNLKRRQELDLVINDALTEFIIMSEDGTNAERIQLLLDTSQKFRTEFMTTSLGRLAVKEAIIEMDRHVRGQVAEALRQLFSSLLLDVEATQNLNYGLWHEKAEAIHELTLMMVKDAIPSIQGELNNKNQHVRLRAQIGIMKLNQGHPLDFLNVLTTPLTDWQQLNLHAELAKLPKENIPSFRPWLQSANPSVVVFAIRMVRIFNQLDLQPYILMRSLHKDPEVRKEVWRFVSFFRIDAGTELITYLLPQTEREVQLEMIRCLGNLESMESEALLEQIVDQDLYDLKQDAALALQKSGYDVLGRWPDLGQSLASLAITNPQMLSQ